MKQIIIPKLSFAERLSKPLAAELDNLLSAIGQHNAAIDSNESHRLALAAPDFIFDENASEVADQLRRESLTLMVKEIVLRKQIRQTLMLCENERAGVIHRAAYAEHQQAWQKVRAGMLKLGWPHPPNGTPEIQVHAAIQIHPDVKGAADRLQGIDNATLRDSISANFQKLKMAESASKTLAERRQRRCLLNETAERLDAGFFVVIGATIATQ